MPAKEIMPLFRAGKLHSGSGGIVKKPKQAKAILLSYLRKEGHDIPEKKSTGFHSKKAR
jgi:predicted rRNA methylase YqxC with S4 and FtsJ domains